MNITEQLDLVIEPSCTIKFASNYFTEVPTILQYESMPLVECYRSLTGPRELRCNLFSADGDLLAVLKGTQLYKTKTGGSAGLTLRYLDGATVCELNGTELLVVKREGSAALSLEAELHTFDGSFIKCATGVECYLGASEQQGLHVNGAAIVGNRFTRCPIGVLVYANGGIAVATSYEPQDGLETKVPEIVV